MLVANSTPVPSETQTDSLPSRIFLLSAYFFPAALAALMLIQALLWLPVRSENLHTEISGVYVAQQFGSGDALYTDFRQPPYAVTPFPPGWYLGLAAAYKLGVHGLDSLLLVGRLWSFASGLLIAILAALCARRCGVPRSLSWLATVAFVGFPLFIPWAVVARQDLPALLFVAIGFFYLSAEPSTRSVIAAACFTSIAFGIKHASLAAPTAIVAYLLLRREWRKAILFSLVWWGLVGSLLLLTQYVSNGLFLVNLSSAKFGPFGLGNAYTAVRELLFSTGHQSILLLLSVALAGVVAAVLERERYPQQWLWACYFFTSFGFALFASGFSNATLNHFLEPAFCWSVLALIALHAMLSQQKAAQLGPVAAASAAFLVLLLFAPGMAAQRWNLAHLRPDDHRKLADLATNRLVLTDLPYVTTHSARPMLLDPISFNFAEQRGEWSSTPLMHSVQQKQFDLIVLHWPVTDPRWASYRYARMNPKMIEEISTHYQLCAEVSEAYVYARSRSSCPVISAQ